jgi:hypothetical protein
VACFRMAPRSIHRLRCLRVEIVDPGKVIRYSSPKPWILAMLLCLILWAMLAWLLYWLLS